MMASKIDPSITWFVDQLNLYQAANSDPASLKRNFVVRTHEFELIMDTLRSKKQADPLQHEMILGRRGSGKSTLLRRLQIEIEEDQTLHKKYIAINLAEEQAGIYRLSDLWYEILQEIKLKANLGLVLKDFSDFNDAQVFTRYLYAEVHKELKRIGKRAVLLLDNFDRILENIDEEANLFREILQNHNDLQIIGGSTRLDEYFWTHDQPFYEFFRRHRLGTLSYDEIRVLLDQWSVVMATPFLKDYAIKNRGKIEALRILTDGLPRTLQFFIQILIHDSSLYGYDYIKKVMDKASPLYQERLNNLTPPQRKIVLELAFNWEAASTRQLVDQCRMKGKLISSFLKQLQSYGIVETINTNTKNHLYRISERFFNMWLIVTQGNPEQKRKAKFLTIFLETWYDPGEIKDLVKNHLVRLSDHNIPIDKATVLTKALSQSRYITLKERDEMIENTKAWSIYIRSRDELPRLYKEIREQIDQLRRLGKYSECLAIIDQIENEADGIKFNLKAEILILMNDVERAEQYYLKAIEVGDKDTILSLALMYAQIEREGEAETCFLRAIEVGVKDAIGYLGVLYHGQGRNVEAEKYYKKAINAGDYYSMHCLAALLSKQGRNVEAEKYYLAAINAGDKYVIPTLIEFYLSNNIEKTKALELIRSYNEFIAPYNLHLKYELIIEIWNNIFDNLELKFENILVQTEYKELESLIEYLLYLEQKNLVLGFFEHTAHGKELQARYQLLFYATLILCNRTSDNLDLRIPSEVRETVQDIVCKVMEKNVFYSQSDSNHLKNDN